jgi:ATP-binding cassette subfamily B protein
MAVAHALELRELPRGPLRFVWTVARGRYRNWLMSLALSEAAHAACGIMLPYALSRIVALATRAATERPAAFETRRAPLLLFGALCLGELLFGRVISALQLRVMPLQRQYVARALFQHLHGHSHRFLSENFAGALAHRVAEVSHGVNQVIWAFLTEFWPIGIVVLVSNLLLASASPWLGAFTISWTIGFVLASVRLARRTQPLSAAASNARSKTVGMIVDSVANHATVRLFARGRYERERLDRAYEPELETVTRANLAMERVRVFQYAASAVLKVGMVVSAVWLWSRAAIDAGQFVMAISLSLLIIAEVRNLSRRVLELFEQLGNVGAGVRAILQPHELPDRRDAGEPKLACGAVDFRDVHFSYPDGFRVFRGLSVQIAAGERVGLVGLSGSGKSTFVNLLLRLYDPQQGTISVAGHALTSIKQDALRAQIGLIPQDPTLFHRSLRENIRYGRLDASDAEVELAAQRARVSEFIRELPGGYDAQVGERGVKLSGGQRQRIAIARVILKDAPILILDEATSSLDSITEHEIQQALDVAMAGKTVVVIAHRLSTIAQLDRILVFSRGAIIEDGSHARLLAQGGAYARLWACQGGGPLAAQEPAEASAHVAG